MAQAAKDKPKGKRGGVRPGASRPKGKASKGNELMRLRLASDPGEMPVEFFLRIMRSDDMPFNLRFDAAKEAAPYCHAKVNITGAFGNGGGNNSNGSPAEITKVERAIVTFEGEWSDINNSDDASVRTLIASEKVQGR